MKRGANSEVKGGNEKGANKSSADVPKEKEHKTLGFNVKSKGHGDHARRGPTKVKGAAGAKSQPNGAGDETTAGESEKKGGTPAGTNKAGGEQGTNQIERLNVRDGIGARRPPDGRLIDHHGGGNTFRAFDSPARHARTGCGLAVAIFRLEFHGVVYYLASLQV